MRWLYVLTGHRYRPAVPFVDVDSLVGRPSDGRTPCPAVPLLLVGPPAAADWTVGLTPGCRRESTGLDEWRPLPARLAGPVSDVFAATLLGDWVDGVAVSRCQVAHLRAADQPGYFLVCGWVVPPAVLAPDWRPM